MKKSARIISVALSLLLVSGGMTSCRKTSKTSNAKNSIVMKEDPWYNSARFTLSMEKSDTDMLMTNTSAEYINGKIYSTYATYDLETSDEKVKLDVYNEQGTKEKALEMKFRDADMRAQEIYSLIPNEDGTTATAVVGVFNGGFEADFVKVDLETGEASEVTPMLDKNGQAVSFISSVTRVGKYEAVQGTDLATGESNGS